MLQYSEQEINHLFMRVNLIFNAFGSLHAFIPLHLVRDLFGSPTFVSNHLSIIICLIAAPSNVSYRVRPHILFLREVK